MLYKIWININLLNLYIHYINYLLKIYYFYRKDIQFVNNIQVKSQWSSMWSIMDFASNSLKMINVTYVWNTLKVMIYYMNYYKRIK